MVNVTIDPTRIAAYISAGYAWLSSSDSYSVCVPVTVGKRYAFIWSNTDSDTVGTIFRFGFTNSSTPSGQTLSGCVRSSPQQDSFVQIVATGQYLVIQMGLSKAASNISNGYITLAEYSDLEIVVGMGAMMTIRRAASNVAPWDYIWDYTMGKPDANGWSLSKTGTTAQSIVSEGLKLTTSTSSSYCYYRPPSPYNDACGAIEAKFKLTHGSSGTGSGYARLCFSNGTNGCHIFARLSTVDDGLFLYDGVGVNESTRIASFPLGVFQTVRCVLDNGKGSVYLNGNLVASNVDASQIKYSGNTSFWWQGAGTTNNYATFEYVKVRVGRI